MPEVQAAFQDYQNYKIDIDKVYTDFIQVIDNYRSHVNISDPNNSSLLKSFTKETFEGAFSGDKIQTEKTPQESRCHAFYRIIGFPVVGSDNSLYNPGHDIIVSKDRAINSEIKASIANKPLNGFKELSDFREKYQNNFLKVFASKSINSSTVALSSINFRKINSVFDKSTDAVEDPFDVKNQSYEIPNNALVGGNSKISLLDFIDSNGNKPSYNFFEKRFHIIKPFAVDPRIEITVPTDKKVAIPFVYDANFLKIDDSRRVEKPLIEKVIKERFSTQNQSDKVGELTKKAIEAIKTTSIIKSEKIVQQISSGSLYGITEKEQFVKFFNISRAIVEKLQESKKIIAEAQSKYYWIPAPSDTGPEGGCTENNIVIKCFSDTVTAKLQTQADLEIVKIYFAKSYDDIAAQVAEIDAVPDPGGYALGNFVSTFDERSSAALGNTNEERLKKLLSERSEYFKKASSALKTIEIIMGEFCGFGLCDIIAIVAGLYIMPSESLLGFLDDDSYKRARLVIKSLPESNPSNITTALKDLSENVKSMYDIIQKLYENFSKTNQKQ